MGNKLSVFASIFAITILLTGTISPSILTFEPADAAKAQGKSVTQYGSKTAGIVCGDRLCSEIAGGRAAFEAEMESFGEEAAPVRGFFDVKDIISSLKDATKAAQDKAETRINQVYSKINAIEQREKHKLREIELNNR